MNAPAATTAVPDHEEEAAAQVAPAVVTQATRYGLPLFGYTGPAKGIACAPETTR